MHEGRHPIRFVLESQVRKRQRTAITYRSPQLRCRTKLLAPVSDTGKTGQVSGLARTSP